MGDRQGAVTRDGKQLVSCHGESVTVTMVMERADRESQEVQLPVAEPLTENWRKITGRKYNNYKAVRGLIL